MESFSPREIKEAHHKDNAISQVIHYTSHGIRPYGTQPKRDSRDVNSLV